jgi:ABC-type sugar transport system permease subunit
MVIQVPLMLVLALIFALILDSGRVWLSKFLRVGIFVPYAVPVVIAALMWGYLYGKDFGPFADIADKLGWPRRTSWREDDAVLARQRRDLDVHGLQHDHPLRGAEVDPHGAV